MCAPYRARLWYVAGAGRVRESACAEPGGSLLPRGGVSRCGVDLLPVAGLHLTQACDSASLARFMALAISVAGVQGREALHSACVCACTRACACVRDNPCFPPGMRMCGCDECVIREDTLGWSVVGTLEREVLGRDCIMESGRGGGTPGEGGGLAQFQPRARSLVEGQGRRRWAYGHLPGVIISRLVFLL